MVEWIKAHKIWVIGGAVALLVLYFISRAGTSAGTSASTGVSVGTDVAAATALQNGQLQAAYANNQLQAASQAQADQTAAQLELGKLAIGQAGAHDQLAATVATSNIDANLKLQSLLGSLSADVAKTQSNNNVQAQQISTTGTVAMQQILADALGKQSDNMVRIQGGNQQAATAIAMSHDQHTGGLFGGGGFLGLGI